MTPGLGEGKDTHDSRDFQGWSKGPIRAHELDIRFYAFGLGSIHSSQAHTFILAARLYLVTHSGYCEAIWIDSKRHD
jgi:hypothetical protein